MTIPHFVDIKFNWQCIRYHAAGLGQIVKYWSDHAKVFFFKHTFLDPIPVLCLESFFLLATTTFCSPLYTNVSNFYSRSHFWCQSCRYIFFPVRHWVLQVREFCQTYQLFSQGSPNQASPSLDFKVKLKSPCFFFASYSFLANNLHFMVKLNNKAIVINVKIHKNERKGFYSSNIENLTCWDKIITANF